MVVLFAPMLIFEIMNMSIADRYIGAGMCVHKDARTSYNVINYNYKKNRFKTK